MDKYEKTDWFPMTTPPVRKGIYEVASPDKEPYPYPFGYWNRQNFCGIAATPKEALLDEDYISVSLNCVGNFWRGIKKPYKKGTR